MHANSFTTAKAVALFCALKKVIAVSIAPTERKSAHQCRMGEEGVVGRGAAAGAKDSWTSRVRNLLPQLKTIRYAPSGTSARPASGILRLAARKCRTVLLGDSTSNIALWNPKLLATLCPPVSLLPKHRIQPTASRRTPGAATTSLRLAWPLLPSTAPLTLFVAVNLVSNCCKTGGQRAADHY